MDQKAKRARKIRCDLTDDARTSGSPALSSSQSSKTCIFFRAESPDFATLNDWYMAVAYTARDRMMEKWIRSLQKLKTESSR